MFCAFAASRNPRSALAGSGAPVPAPVIDVVAGAAVVVVLLAEEQADTALNRATPTISFFIQRSPFSVPGSSLRRDAPRVGVPLSAYDEKSAALHQHRSYRDRATSAPRHLSRSD